MLQPLEKELLSDVYSYYLQTGKRSMQYNFSSNIREKQALISCLDVLRDEGYITYEYQAAGFCGIRLSPEGIKFVENGYQEISNTSPSINGSNNIFVNGSGNTISDNYNHISIDIESSELSPEHKELLKTLVYELKNPNLSKEKRIAKIKAFLSEVSSGTLSNTAASVLTTLLSSLFGNIQF